MKKPIITVSPEVKALLPGVLIDWLCGVVNTDALAQSPAQTITLSQGLLGGQTVQDIHYANTEKRVFGFPPVTCTLRLIRRNHHYLMALAK